MKTKILSLIAAVALVVMAASCTTVAPLTATSNNVGTKVGEASGSWLFTVFPFNHDRGIQAAAKNGGISRISTVDVKTFNVIGIWTTRTTIVTGE